MKRRKKEFTYRVDVFSPRWQHDDQYEVKFSNEGFQINHMQRIAYYNWTEETGVNWRGDKLHNIFNNDRIYAPKNFEDLLVHVWLSWQDGDLSKTGTERQLKSLFTWLNKISKSKPKTIFWRGYF